MAAARLLLNCAGATRLNDGAFAEEAGMQKGARRRQIQVPSHGAKVLR